MCIRDQIGAGDLFNKKGFQDFLMSLSWKRDPGRRTGKPFLNLAPSIGHGFWPLEYAGVSYNANKSEKAQLGKTDRRGAIETAFEPDFHLLMGRKAGYMGVDEDVGVDEDHLNFSPSAKASNSAISSMFPVLQRPRETDLVRNVFGD